MFIKIKEFQLFYFIFDRLVDFVSEAVQLLPGLCWTMSL